METNPAAPQSEGLYGLGPSSPRSEPSPIIQEEAKKTVRGWVALVNSDRKFCKALDVLKAHQPEPIVKELLGSWLPVLACLAVPRKGGGGKKTLQKIWASESGKTWKALREFPARLRGVADEVERINESDFLSPSTWIRDDETKARIVKSHFLRLPGILRVYAAYLHKLLVEKMPATWGRHFPSGPRGHSQSLFYLSHLVKACTGRFHDKDVCDLLDAAACVLGVNYQFDPTLLAQARGRRARKRPAP